MHGPDAAYYERVQRWAASPAHRREERALIQALALPAGARVLDAGCGTGPLLAALRSAGLNPVGVDLPAAAAALNRERPLVRADLYRLPFAAASFDGAALMHVVAHLADPPAVLAGLRRVLRPGAPLAVITPNRRFLEAMALPTRLGGRYVPDPTVERHVNRGELAAMLVAGGFTGVTVRTWGKLPWTAPLPGFRERLLAVAIRPPGEDS